MRNVEDVMGKYIFRNNGNVYMNSLNTIPIKGKAINNELSMMNKGSVDMQSYDICDDMCIPLLMSTNRCEIRSNKCFGPYDKAKNPFSPVYYKEDGVQEYKNTSFLKRYGIEIENGYAILYKGVGSKTHKAPYDDCDVVWDSLGLYEHESWNPYDNEIGKGKFVASYSPDVFYMFLNSKGFDVLKIKVALCDLYEWPSFMSKYPYLIGFRAGEVIEIKRFSL